MFPAMCRTTSFEHKDFPHDSTAEQWFTESQFESYRRLGQRVVARIDRLFTKAEMWALLSRKGIDLVGLCHRGVGGGRRLAPRLSPPAGCR